jgi:hypothetical protein
MLMGKMIFHDRAILMANGLEYDRILNLLSGSGLVRPNDDFAGR